MFSLAVSSLFHRVQKFVGYRLLRAPDVVLRHTTLRRPVSIDGQRLDARMQHAVAVLSIGQRTPMYELSPSAARREYGRMADVCDDPPLAMAAVDNRQVEHDGRSFAVRIYRPRVRATPMPALLYFHGGGGVIGDLDTHDSACRLLAKHSDCVVVSAEYSLGPEAPFPAAPRDTFAAWSWLREHAASLGLDDTKLAIGGDSMGGCLAAVTTQAARDQGVPQPCAQLLIYPATDRGGDRPSRSLFGDDLLLTTPLLRWFVDNYTGGADPLDPQVSPLRASDLTGLAPAIVITAGFDPLRDEGQDYAEALRAAGVQVHERCYDSLIHGFVQMTAVVPAAHRATVEMAEALRGLLAAS